MPVKSHQHLGLSLNPHTLASHFRLLQEVESIEVSNLVFEELSFNFEAAATAAASASISRLLLLWSQYKSIPTKIGKTVIHSFASNSYLLFLNRDRSSSSFFYI